MSTKTLHIAVPCPVDLCDGEHDVVVVLETVPGRHGWSVDDHQINGSDCACLQSKFVNRDAVREHLYDAATERALAA